MSFKSYSVHTLPDGSLTLDDPQPLVFSGKQGLIARFVLAAPRRAEGRWTLCPGELHALATPTLQTRERLIVFEQSTGSALELLVLETVHGISQERTEMMFAFKPLRVIERTPRLRVRRVGDAATYVEELTLEGGAYAPDASWHWRRPHLALGGVVCGTHPAAASPDAAVTIVPGRSASAPAGTPALAH